MQTMMCQFTQLSTRKTDSDAKAMLTTIGFVPATTSATSGRESVSRLREQPQAAIRVFRLRPATSVLEQKFSRKE